MQRIRYYIIANEFPYGFDNAWLSVAYYYYTCSKGSFFWKGGKSKNGSILYSILERRKEYKNPCLQSPHFKSILYNGSHMSQDPFFLSIAPSNCNLPCMANHFIIIQYYDNY